MEKNWTSGQHTDLVNVLEEDIVNAVTRPVIEFHRTKIISNLVLVINNQISLVAVELCNVYRTV